MSPPARKNHVYQQDLLVRAIWVDDQPRLPVANPQTLPYRGAMSPKPLTGIAQRDRHGSVLCNPTAYPLSFREPEPTLMPAPPDAQSRYCRILTLLALAVAWVSAQSETASVSAPPVQVAAPEQPVAVSTPPAPAAAAERPAEAATPPAQVATAECPAEAAKPPAKNLVQRTISRIPGLFEIDLPKTERRGVVKFIVHPHFRDLISRGYLRIPFGFRWGVNDHFELNSDIDTHIDHGLRKGSGSYGLTALHFGAKYGGCDWFKPTWDTSYGFNSSIPVSRPPLDLTDGMNHFAPYIVFGRKIEDIKGLSGFVDLGADFVSHSSTPGNPGRNQPRSHSMRVSPGLLYDWNAWHFTLEATGTTTRQIGKGNHDYLMIRPGVIWDLPKQLVFNARGRWLAGFNATFRFGPDGRSVGTGGKLRGEINLRRLFGGDKRDDETGWNGNGAVK